MTKTKELKLAGNTSVIDDVKSTSKKEPAPKSKTKKNVIMLALNDAQHDKLKAYSERHDIAKTAVIKLALCEYLKDY